MRTLKCQAAFRYFNSSKVRLERLTDNLKTFVWYYISIPVRYDWNFREPVPRGRPDYISIPVRYDWNRLQRCRHRSRCCISIPVRYDWNDKLVSISLTAKHISIPVRYDWNQAQAAGKNRLRDFNSSKVRLEPNGYRLFPFWYVDFNSSKVRLELQRFKILI